MEKEIEAYMLDSEEEAAIMEIVVLWEEIIALVVMNLLRL